MHPHRMQAPTTTRLKQKGIDTLGQAHLELPRNVTPMGYHAAWDAAPRGARTEAVLKALEADRGWMTVEALVACTDIERRVMTSILYSLQRQSKVARFEASRRGIRRQDSYALVDNQTVMPTPVTRVRDYSPRRATQRMSCGRAIQPERGARDNGLASEAYFLPQWLMPRAPRNPLTSIGRAHCVHTLVTDADMLDVDDDEGMIDEAQAGNQG